VFGEISDVTVEPT